MTDPDTTEAVFAALGDTTRRELLRCLAVEGPATATGLANGRGISRQAVSKHLVVLDRAGLVAAERVGREVRYHAVPESLGAAADWIRVTGQAWDRRLGRLTEVLRDSSDR